MSNQELIQMLKMVGYATLAELLVLISIKFLDGKDHRLGTIQLQETNSFFDMRF